MLSSREPRGGLQACYSSFSLAKSAEKGRGSKVSLRRVGFRHQPERAKILLGRGVTIIAPAPLSCGTPSGLDLNNPVLATTVSMSSYVPLLGLEGLFFLVSSIPIVSYNLSISLG